MVWVTPETATPAVIVPAEAVEQVYAETIAVPLVEGSIKAAQFFQLAAELVPILVWIEFSVVLKMVKPLAGLTIALRCAVVIRGKSMPWLVLTTSSAALALGVVVPMPTCAMLVSELAVINSVIIIFFFILSTLNFLLY
jgi:hypothetical protein